MSEYRHIANLTGPQGERGADATEIPGSSIGNPIYLDGSEDLDTLEPKFYRIPTNSAAESLGLPRASAGSLDVRAVGATMRSQTFTTAYTGEIGGMQIYNRGTASNGVYVVPWTLQYDSINPYHPGSGVANPDQLPPGDPADLEPKTYSVSGAQATDILGLDEARPGLLEVLPSYSSAGTMFKTYRFTTAWSGTAFPLKTWYRGTTTSGVFGEDWQLAYDSNTPPVQSGVVSKIVRSPASNVALNDGDLLLVTRGEYETDFSTGLEGWTLRQGSANAWSVVEGEGELSGFAIHRSHNDRSEQVWEAVPNTRDIDVVARVKTTGDANGNNVGIGARIHSNVSGVYLFLGRNSGEPEIRVSEYTEDSATFIGRTPFAWQEGEWIWIRLRLTGNIARAKAWADGQVEPPEWSISTTSDEMSTASGGVSIFSIPAAAEAWWDKVDAQRAGA